jgi:acetamidase/formamidase
VQRIPREQARGYRLDATLEPILRVAVGEPFSVETEDASSGHLTAADRPPTPENTPYVRYAPAMANPVGGPVFVEGIEAGSRVNIEILEIRLAESGVAYNQPPCSPLGNAADWPDAHEYFLVKVEHRLTEAFVSERLRWPISPMVGTLACAPDWEARSSSSGQGPWGGNLDVADFRAGAVVTLNSYHAGGLLFVGDVHGCQGDGEYFGTADESRAEVVLRASPAAGAPLAAPRVRSPERIVALGIDRPLEDAAWAAARRLMEWLVEEFGYSHREAYLTLGLNPDFHFIIHQMTAIQDLRFVVGAALPTKYVQPA